MQAALLTTKLTPPPPRPASQRVARPQLVKRLNWGLDSGQKLTLISAPAGFGKTTVIAEWIHGWREAKSAIKAAWLSLDQNDNDPNRFLAYLVAALNSETPAAPSSPQPLPAESILTPVINQIVQQGEQLVLVLDDYHLITARPVHDAVTFLLDNQPSQLHLVILTRADPPLPLSRMRARGQITEIREEDLRFTTQEVDAFLNRIMELALTPQQVVALEIRTEGWVAGLQLAAVSMRGRDAEQFVQSFAGSNRYILDYLSEEVLDQQPNTTRSFLLHTSILEQLSAPLCTTLTNQDNCQEILEQLERDNLFMVPLDLERRWYRYHHLFADLLRARLQQLEPERIPELHRRAANWLAQHQFPTQAVNHALAAGDYAQAADWIEQHTVDLFVRGHLHTLEAWIKALPEELALQRPWLCVYQAWAQVMAGKYGEVAPLLTAAEAHLPADDLAGQKELRGQIATMRAYMAAALGQTDQVFALAQIAEENLPKEKLWEHSILQWALGTAYRTQGNLPNAIHLFEQLIKTGRTLNNIWTITTGMTDLALVYRSQGRLREAVALYEQLFQLAAEHGGQQGYLGRAQAAYTGVLCDLNRLDKAERLVRESLEKTHAWQNPNHYVYSYLNLARVLRARGELTEAAETLNQAGQVRDQHPVMPVLSGLVDYYQIKLWLDQGQSAAAESLLTDNPLNQNRDLLLLARGRVQIAKKQGGAALKTLNQLEQMARATGRIDTLLEVQILQALAFRVQRDSELAQRPLGDALELAQSGGHVRLFLDEGRPMVELLKTAATREQPCAQELLSILQAELGAPQETSPDQTSPLIDPLTTRELQVLHLLAQGLTNQQIADQLIVAKGTVKAHVASIYRKLDTHNRTQAINRARDFGLI